LLQPFICNSSLKIRWQELQDTPDKSPRSSIVLRRSSKISSRIIAMFSSVRKVECRPERRWSASDNSPFLKREKPLVDLRFPQCSFLVSCFKTLQLFPLPFSLTENRISQPHVVPTFQPSQKSTNKREALNKKIYYVAPRHNSTLPVCRLMQKGSRKRHLAAKAFTTTDPPTRERFQFLLGPPTYTHRQRYINEDIIVPNTDNFMICNFTFLQFYTGYRYHRTE